MTDTTAVTLENNTTNNINKNTTPVGTDAKEQDTGQKFPKNLKFVITEEEKDFDYITIENKSVVKGKIIKIDKKFITVDIGYKSLGLVPKEQFYDDENNFLAKIGKKDDFYVESVENKEGQIKLSKDKVKILKVWEKIKETHANDKTIKGTIIEKIKGGMKVDIGVTAFLPNSQIDLKPILNLDIFIGQNFDFKILKCSKSKSNIVLSRRALLEVGRVKERTKTLKSIKKGALIKGIAKNITSYGVFVDIGGIDGLLHITDMTWGRILHPSDICKIGDELELIITDFDLEKNKISLSLKDKTKDPWSNINKYKNGDIIEGKVINVTDYGIFIEIEKGVEGLVHISDLSWVKKITTTSNIKEIGSKIKAVIKDINIEERKIALSVKDLTDDPWKVAKDNIKQGDILDGEVQNITDYGLFVTLESGIDGLVHTTDVDWNKRGEDLTTTFRKKQKVKVKVLSLDPDSKRLSLGIKQITKDPWSNIHKLSASDLVRGTITYIGNYGLFIQNQDKIEGLLHINKIDTKLNSKEKIEEIYSVGDIIAVKVLKIEAKNRKLAFILPKSKKATEDTVDIENSKSTQKENQLESKTDNKAKASDRSTKTDDTAKVSNISAKTDVTTAKVGNIEEKK